MHKLVTLLVLLGNAYGLFAQTISGVVTDAAGDPLEAVNIYWAGTSVGTLTEADGQFLLKTIPDEQRLVASYVGYRPDTLVVTTGPVNFVLRSNAFMDMFEVTERRDGAVQSNRSLVKTEVINEVELTKAACCDLAGCFNTQLTVQPQTTNVLTNSKELRILGLSGVYNQTLIDGFPLIQGLAYTYGISSVPGTLVGNIFVAKGANSVLQGFESITGQINVLTRDPVTTDKLLLNAYVNSFGETQYNINHAFKAGRWNALVSGGMVQPAARIDRDADTFLDLPLLTRYTGFTKWTTGKAAEWGWSSTSTLRYVDEQRVGGQVGFDPATDVGSTNSYGQTVNYQQVEATSRTAYRPNDTHNFVLFASAQYHDQRSTFGTVGYAAAQTATYLNAQYELRYGKHQLTTGLSHRFFLLDEQIAVPTNDTFRSYGGDYRREESIPGVFVENTARFLDDRLTWIAGLRVDRHNLYGTQLSPRSLVKFDFDEATTVRASIGRGWRSVQLFPENLQLLVSARDVRVTEPLDAEAAVNYGLNLTRQLKADGVSGYISTDFYRTIFQNQVFPDYDSDPTLALVSNFRGTSIGTGLQTDVVLRFPGGWETKAGYNFLDVYRESDGERTLLPFIARHKLFGSLSYRPASDRYQIDLNGHWYGRQRLPDTSTNPEQFQRPDFSEPYATADVQFTYKWKRLEVYTGLENVFDFRQQRPILGWQNPFGRYFDTSAVWGPTRGREVYLGVRYAIEKDGGAAAPSVVD